jgi:hypothetical protein
MNLPELSIDRDLKVGYIIGFIVRITNKKSYSWDGYIEMLKYYPLAKPKIYFKLF